MRDFLETLLPARSVRRWIAVGFYYNPLLFVVSIFRSAYASWRLTGRVHGLPVRLSCGQRLLVRRHHSAQVQFSGSLLVERFGGGVGLSSVILGPCARLQILGDFTIGQNVHLSVSSGASLLCGGVKRASGSGITCDARVMAASSIHIGADAIIAWGVVITDSDWHEVDGRVHVSPVEIGEHVWIAHDCSILRGASIPDGCVVAAKSLVGKAYHEQNALMAGAPAKVIRRNIEWSR